MIKTLTQAIVKEMMLAFIGIPFAASAIVASSSPTVSTSGNRSKTVSAST